MLFGLNWGPVGREIAQWWTTLSDEDQFVVSVLAIAAGMIFVYVKISSETVTPPPPSTNAQQQYPPPSVVRPPASTEAPTPRFCPQCGTRAVPGLFCGACGSKLVQ
jgi:hypothetical protein